MRALLLIFILASCQSQQEVADTQGKLEANQDDIAWLDQEIETSNDESLIAERDVLLKENEKLKQQLSVQQAQVDSEVGAGAIIAGSILPGGAALWQALAALGSAGAVFVQRKKHLK